MTGNVIGDLLIARPLNVDEITLDITGSLNYSGPLVAPARGGSLFGPPSDGRHFTLFANSFHFSLTGGVPPMTLNGGDADSLKGLFAGGSGGVLNVGTDARPTQGRINVDAPVSATTGANGFGVSYGGDGGTVNLVSNDKISVSSQIKVSESAPGRASRKGGNIVLNSRKTNGTAIDIG